MPESFTITQITRRAIVIKNEQGSISARNILVLSNIGLVYYFAFQYCGHGIPKDDLVSIACIGLIDAVEHYEPSRGSFSSCAYWWIQNAIFKEFHKDKFIYLPDKQRGNCRIIEKAIRKLEQRLHREPLSEEIGEFTGLPLDTVKAAIQNSRLKTVFINEHSPDIEAHFPLHCESDPELTAWELEERINKLSPREQSIIQSYYKGGLTLEEIGKELGSLSRERVRKILQKAISKLAIHGLSKKGERRGTIGG